MELLLAFVIGAQYAAGLYMMLRRSVVKLLIGLALLTNAANLLIFTASGLTRGNPALADELPARSGSGAADPLPQALILTAIVIGFGVLAFAIALVHRAYQMLGSDDIDRMNTTDT
jgi:multicomponent Na+:H+ antiporter subunit C